MLILSCPIQDDSILIRIQCQTKFLSQQGVEEPVSAFRILLIDSGYYLNAPLNAFLKRDTVYTEDGKFNLNEITLDRLLPDESNEKKDRNEPYRRLHSWSMFSGRLMRYSNGDESCYTPILDKVADDASGKDLSISLNLLIVTERQATMADVRKLLEEQLARQLDLLETFFYNNQQTTMLKTYQHYYIPCINQIVTCADHEHDQVRRELQQRYPQLSFNVPLVALDTSERSISVLARNGRLFNVHKNLPSKVKGGQQTLVNGHYAYYHYMQDNFDDNMWGCAYRSLQTLCSWFILQGYTEKPVPTHTQIQQILIDIGDRPKNFLNSREWIGSMEVSFVLQNYLNVDCKILRVERGAELVEHVRDIIGHFNKEGTPIMIGGGVLAHTIIGVDFNESTGDSMLLVLDPHYTGTDDIKTIQDKGWAGWKPWSFWTPNAFYNLCCPMKPKQNSV